MNDLSKKVYEFLHANTQISVIYDIGAFKGEFSKSLAKITKGQCFLFEPNQYDEQKEFSNVFNAYLSNANETRKFYCVRNTGDSLYKEKTKVYQNIDGKEVNTVTLDSIAEKNKLPVPDLIKLDTQGSELDILKGYSNVGKIKFVQIEVTLVPDYNSKSPKMFDVMKYMESQDFELYDIVENLRISFIMTQVDLVFINRKIPFYQLVKDNFVPALNFG